MQKPNVKNPIGKKTKSIQKLRQTGFGVGRSDQSAVGDRTALEGDPNDE
jgi:hypothetical protein